jgi:hypothetical protein
MRLQTLGAVDPAVGLDVGGRLPGGRLPDGGHIHAEELGAALQERRSAR